MRVPASEYRRHYIARGKTLALVLALAGGLGACAHTKPPLDSHAEEPRVESPEHTEVLDAIPGSKPVPVAVHWQKYKGRKKYVGNGHCVKLVLDAVPALGHTSKWARGTHVYGNDSLEPGTPIATFDATGAYANRRWGYSHAALYVRQSEAGLYVIDQWRPTRKSRGQRPRERFIPWAGGQGTLPANSGLAYYVIHRLNPIEIGSAED